MQRASQIIGKFASASQNRKGAEPVFDAEQVACAAWARAVGRKLAQHTRASRLVRGRLVVEVEDAVWQRNLFFLSKQILKNLHEALGPDVVADIEFRIVPPRKPPRKEVQRATSGTPGGSMFDEADSIEDRGMRRLYRAARLKSRG